VPLPSCRYRDRLPESWVPPAYVLEVRTLGRLYCALMDQRRAWQQRIHAQLYHQGAPAVTGLLTEAGRAAVAAADLSPAGRQSVDAALQAVDSLTGQITPLRKQLVGIARGLPGCRALQRLYGVGWLCAAIIWAELGDCRRFTSSDQAVRFAGLDITVYSSAGKRSPGRLARQGPPELRWALYEAAKCASRRSSPDYHYYRKVADRLGGKRPALSVARWPAAATTPCVAWVRRPSARRSGRRRWSPDGDAARSAHDSADARGQLPPGS
jgi:transposase